MVCFSLFLGMSSGCGIGGIQLTVFASYSVVNYKKPVCMLVFCREAMKRCGITLATP